MVGLLLLSPSHVLPSRQDSSPHSLSCLGRGSFAELLECPTPFANTVLEAPPELVQDIPMVKSRWSVFDVASSGCSVPVRQRKYNSIQPVDAANQQRGTGLLSVKTVWVDPMLKKRQQVKDSKRSLRRLRRSVCAA